MYAAVARRARELGVLRSLGFQRRSLVMSFFLLTISIGDLLVAAITELFSNPAAGGGSESVSTKRFFLYAGLTFVVAILFSIVAAHYNYRDKAAAEGK